MFEYSLDSEIASDYNYSDSPEYDDYGSDSSEEKTLSGPAQGLVIISTPHGRFVYWPDQKPYDLAMDDNSRLVASLDTLPYQEGAPLPSLQEEGGDTKLLISSSGS